MTDAVLYKSLYIIMQERLKSKSDINKQNMRETR